MTFRSYFFTASWACAAIAACASLTAAEEELCNTAGTRVPGPVTYTGGTWNAGSAKVPASEVLMVQFTEYAPPERVASGVFVRGGSLIIGVVDSLIGDKLTLNARSLSTVLELKRDDLMGAFFALPNGAPESFPALGRYGPMVATLSVPPGDEKMSESFGGAQIFPGRRDRVTFGNLDGLDGKVMRLGNEKAIVELSGGKLSTPDRERLRLIECKLAPAAPEKDDGKSSAEVFVRLKAGDVLRGRIAKLDDKALTLNTTFCGALTLPRETLAALFPAGGPAAGLQWLSLLKPSTNTHTPVFDADFPAKLNLSVEGHLMKLGGLVCDRGIGAHSKSEIAFPFEPKAGRKFVAFVGIDDETKGRGLAEAKVLVDGAVVFASGPLKGGEAPKPVVVKLDKGKELKLVVEYGSDNDDSGDHVDWGWAALVN